MSVTSWPYVRKQPVAVLIDWQAAFDAKSKRLAMTAFENAIARPRINFGREIDDCRREMKRDIERDPWLAGIILNLYLKAQLLIHRLPASERRVINR